MTECHPSTNESASSSSDEDISAAVAVEAEAGAAGAVAVVVDRDFTWKNKLHDLFTNLFRLQHQTTVQLTLDESGLVYVTIYPFW